MLEYVRTRLRRPALWIWVVCVVAVGAAAACSDVQPPRVTDETEDTLQDSIKNAG
jgi:hypothetical protein